MHLVKPFFKKVPILPVINFLRDSFNSKETSGTTATEFIPEFPCVSLLPNELNKAPKEKRIESMIAHLCKILVTQQVNDLLEIRSQ